MNSCIDSSSRSIVPPKRLQACSEKRSEHNNRNDESPHVVKPVWPLVAGDHRVNPPEKEHNAEGYQLHLKGLDRPVQEI